MKLTYVCFEGTPQELDESEAVRELVRQWSGTVDTVRRTPRAVVDPESDDEVDFGWLVEGDVPGVVEEGQSTVKAQLAFNPAAQQFLDFMMEATSWEGVVVHGIKRKTWQEGIRSTTRATSGSAARAASMAASCTSSRRRE